MSTDTLTAPPPAPGAVATPAPMAPPVPPAPSAGISGGGVVDVSAVDTEAIQKEVRALLDLGGSEPPPVSKPDPPPEPAPAAAEPTSETEAQPESKAEPEPQPEPEAQTEVAAPNPQPEQTPAETPPPLEPASVAWATPEPAANETPSASEKPGRLAAILMGSLRVLVFVLTVLDIPFAFLGPRIKSLIGYIAIATAIVAAATWIVGPRLAAGCAQSHPQTQPATVSETQPADLDALPMYHEIPPLNSQASED